MRLGVSGRMRRTPSSSLAKPLSTRPVRFLLFHFPTLAPKTSGCNSRASCSIASTSPGEGRDDFVAGHHHVPQFHRLQIAPGRPVAQIVHLRGRLRCQMVRRSAQYNPAASAPLLPCSPAANFGGDVIMDSAPAQRSASAIKVFCPIEISGSSHTTKSTCTIGRSCSVACSVSSRFCSAATSVAPCSLAPSKSAIIRGRTQHSGHGVRVAGVHRHSQFQQRVRCFGSIDGRGCQHQVRMQRDDRFQARILRRADMRLFLRGGGNVAIRRVARELRFQPKRVNRFRQVRRQSSRRARTFSGIAMRRPVSSVTNFVVRLFAEFARQGSPVPVPRRRALL